MYSNICTFVQFLEAINSQEHSDLVWQYVENTLSEAIMRYQVSSDSVGSREEFEDLLCKLISSVDKTTVHIYILNKAYLKRLLIN